MSEFDLTITDGLKTKGRLANQMDRMDFTILDYYCDNPRATVSQMAAVIGLARSSIHERMKRKVFVHHFHERMKAIAASIAAAQRAAIRRLHKIVEVSPDAQAIKASAILLAIDPSMTESSSASEIVFRTRLGSDGVLMQEQMKIEDGKGKELTTIDLMATLDEEENATKEEK